MFGRNWSSGYGEKDFLNIFNIILLFRNYLPLEKGVALNLKKKNESCFVPSLDGISPVVLEKIFKYFQFIFCYFAPSFLPWRRAWTLMKKLGSPSQKDVLGQVWLKMAQWRRRFLNIFNRNLLFRNYLPS